MISSVHTMIFSTHVEADRAFLRDVLGLVHVDAGGGFMIYGVPTAELAVHEGPKNDVHELFLMCNDIEAFVETMSARGIACPDVQDRGWGLATEVPLPGGGKLGVYEPRHPQPKHAAPKASANPSPKAKRTPKAKAKPKPKPKPKPKSKGKGKGKGKGKSKSKSKSKKSKARRSAGARKK